MANICIQMCESMYQVPTRIACFILVLIQGAILDYYLVTYKSVYWYGWIAADIAVSLIFIIAFVISFRHLKLVHKESSRHTNIQAGSLPLGYFAWFVYSVALATRVAIIFKDFAWKLKEEDFFGPNTLKITIALAGLIFVLLLFTHHDALYGSDRQRFIDILTATVVFDILDSVDALDILFDKVDVDDLPEELRIIIISTACVNLILPALPLITLSRTHFGNKPESHVFIVLHKLLLVFFVNLPLLVIRLLLWHVLSKEISIFPVKNVVMMFLIFHELYEERRASLHQPEGSLNEREMRSYDTNGETKPMNMM